MRTIRLPIHNDPATHNDDRERVIDAIRKCPTGVTVTITAGVLRSDNQNAFYWGVILPIISEYQQGIVGTKRDLERLHDDLLIKFELVGEGVNEAGTPVYYVNSTTQMTTTQFEDYLEKIRAYFAENESLILPLPNEVEPVETRVKIIERRKQRLTELEAANAEITRLRLELNTLKENAKVD